MVNHLKTLIFQSCRFVYLKRQMMPTASFGTQFYERFGLMDYGGRDPPSCPLAEKEQADWGEEKEFIREVGSTS